jgi:hypothetical protein
VSIIVFDKQDQFRIEEFHKDVMVFADGPIKNNTCVDHPSVARLTVEAKRNEFTFAKLAAAIDLR